MILGVILSNLKSIYLEDFLAGWIRDAMRTKGSLTNLNSPSTLMSQEKSMPPSNFKPAEASLIPNPNHFDSISTNAVRLKYADMENWIFAFPVDSIYRRSVWNKFLHEKKKTQTNKTTTKKQTKTAILGEKLKLWSVTKRRPMTSLNGAKLNRRWLLNCTGKRNRKIKKLRNHSFCYKTKIISTHVFCLL